jgi:hypothetical protein
MCVQYGHFAVMIIKRFDHLVHVFRPKQQELLLLHVRKDFTIRN